MQGAHERANGVVPNLAQSTAQRAQLAGGPGGPWGSAALVIVAVRLVLAASPAAASGLAACAVPLKGRQTCVKQKRQILVVNAA
jgi:hypothetical protein